MLLGFLSLLFLKKCVFSLVKGFNPCLLSYSPFRCGCDRKVCSAGVPVRWCGARSHPVWQSPDELPKTHRPVVGLYRSNGQTWVTEGCQVSPPCFQTQVIYVSVNIGSHKLILKYDHVPLAGSFLIAWSIWVFQWKRSSSFSSAIWSTRKSTAPHRASRQSKRKP